MKTVCIVDDKLVVLEALKVILSEVDDLVMIGAFTSAEEFIEQYATLLLDISIVDISMPGMSGIEAILAVKTIYKESKFLVLTNYADDELLFNALRAGADGYLLKKQSLENIPAAIASIYTGGAPMTAEIAKKVVDYFHHHPAMDKMYHLTEKEKQVLQLLVDGLLYKEIAGEMDVTVDAIKKTYTTYLPKATGKNQERSNKEIPQ